MQYRLQGCNFPPNEAAAMKWIFVRLGFLASATALLVAAMLMWQEPATNIIDSGLDRTPVSASHSGVRPMVADNNILLLIFGLSQGTDVR